MNSRLWTLYLRSRRVGPAVVAVAGVATLAWWLLAASDDPSLTMLLLTVVPLGAAAVVGVGAGSPFGEAERTASRALATLRLGHLGGLLAWEALALAVANRAEPGDATAWTLVRNGAGYAGVALLGARFLGAGVAWAPPVAYGALVAVAALGGADPDAWWLWPVRATGDGSALAIALGVLLAGLAIVAVQGARDVPGEGG